MQAEGANDRAGLLPVTVALLCFPALSGIALLVFGGNTTSGDDDRLAALC